MRNVLKFHYGFVIAGISFVLLIFTSGMLLSIGVFIKPISQEFSWERSVFSAIIAVFMIVQGIFSPYIGTLIVKIGPKKLISTGVALQGLVYVSLFFLKNLPQLFISYSIIMAIAYGTTALVTISVLISLWFEKKRGLVMGLTMAGLPLGPQLLTPLITYSVLNFGWRTTFLCLGIILLVGLLPLLMKLIKDHPKDLGLLPYGKLENSHPDQTELTEETITVSYLAIIKNKEFYKLAFSYFACGFTMSFISTHYYSHGTDIGLNPMVIAFALGLMGTAAAVGTTVAGGLSDKFGRKSMLASVYLVRAISFLLLGFTNDTFLIYTGAIIYGLSWTATGPLTSTLAGEIWGISAMGKVFGSIFLVHQIGASLGAFVGGIIYDYTGKYSIAFMISLFVLAVGAGLSFSVKEGHYKKITPPLKSTSVTDLS